MDRDRNGSNSNQDRRFRGRENETRELDSDRNPFDMLRELFLPSVQRLVAANRISPSEMVRVFSYVDVIRNRYFELNDAERAQMVRSIVQRGSSQPVLTLSSSHDTSLFSQPMAHAPFQAATSSYAQSSTPLNHSLLRDSELYHLLLGCLQDISSVLEMDQLSLSVPEESNLSDYDFTNFSSDDDYH